MSERDIAVKFTGDSRDLERAADKADKSVGESGKSMGGALAGLAGPAAIGAAAIGGLAVAGIGLANAAAEDEAAAAQLAHQLRQAAGASDEAVEGAENYITALSKSAAIADDELRPALSKLATVTGDTGKAQELLALATDISAGTGKDLATVTDALSKAQLGGTGALKKMGVAVEDADGNALSLEATLAKAGETFKGAADIAANTGAGGMKKAAIGFGELQESIGAKLLPVLGAVGTFINDTVLPGFDALVAWAEEQWPKVLEAIQPALTTLQEVFSTVVATITDLWNEWGDELMTVVGFIVGVLRDQLMFRIQVLGFVIEQVIERLKAFWAAWGDQIVETATTIITTVVELGKKIWEIITTVVDAVKSFWVENGELFTGFAEAMIELVAALADRVMSIIGPLVGFLIDVIGTGLRVVFTVVGAVLDAIGWIWERWGDEIMSVVGTVFGIIGTVIAGVMQIVLGVIRTVTAIIKGDWSGAWEAVKDTVRGGIDFVIDLMNRIGGLVTGALVGLADLITKPFRIAFNSIADLWNNTIGALSFTFPEWIPGLGGNRIDVPDVPRFSTFGAMTIVMPAGSDGYDVARQLTTFTRNVGPVTTAVAVR
jgi:hypothetical protein